MRNIGRFCAGLVAICSALSTTIAADLDKDTGRALSVESQAGQLVIVRNATPAATYVYRDDQIRRPFFANVLVPSGMLVTRHYPPRPDIDAVDHAAMHPGIWLAFGDINGHDFWRNKERVEHVEFVRPPEARMDRGDGVVTFTARNRYLAGNALVCEEIARHTIRSSVHGYWFLFDSQFSAAHPFSFGDQEEMGLGVRVATPIAVKGGAGTITSSQGAKNESQVWGHQADWCEYGAIVTEMTSPLNTTPAHERKLRAGMFVVPHPQNFRRSWMHGRDYGLLVANPFGRQAFTKGAASRVKIKPGEKFRIRYGVWAYAADPDTKLDLNKSAREYIRLAND